MNFVNIAGHLGADPEVRFTSTGKKVTTLRVATRSRKGGADVTIWWRVTIWGEQFDKIATQLEEKILSQAVGGAVGGAVGDASHAQATGQALKQLNLGSWGAMANCY